MMGDYVAIAGKLRDTDAQIARWEGVLRRDPAEEIAQDMIATLEKRQQELQRAFAEATEEEWLDVCSYRVFDIDEQKEILAAAIANTIAKFQSALTSVYDAYKNGRKDKQRLDAETVKEAAMGFGFSFNGSVGFVMTMPNERLLTGDSNLDMAMKTLFDIARSSTPDEVNQFAQELGPGPIRRVYEWAEDHVSYKVNSDIKWLRNQDQLGTLVADVEQMQKLKEVIDMASPESIAEIDLEGLLVGADTVTKKFHMTFPDADEIKGDLDSTLAEQQIEVNHHYAAKLRKTTKVIYSTEKELVTWVLLSIK